jgi:hypothetical protein
MGLGEGGTAVFDRDGNEFHFSPNVFESGDGGGAYLAILS